METIKNLSEYYDELYPVTDAQKKFYANLKKEYAAPVKFLHIGCGTGMLEHTLAQDGSDVTGLEIFKELIDSANLRRRTQLISIRFFQLSTLDMTRFLGKHFYNIISCLNNRILFIRDRTLMRKFFFDCRELMAPGGSLILEFVNLDSLPQETTVQLPVRESIRVKLFTKLTRKENELPYIDQQLETGSGDLLPIMQKEQLYPLTKSEVIEFGKDAGFSQFDFYSSYNGDESTQSSDTLLCRLK